MPIIGEIYSIKSYFHLYTSPDMETVRWNSVCERRRWTCDKIPKVMPFEESDQLILTDMETVEEPESFSNPPIVTTCYKFFFPKKPMSFWMAISYDLGSINKVTFEEFFRKVSGA